MPSDTRVLNTVAHGICVVDDEMQVVFANHRLMAQIGCSADALLGRPFSDLIAEDHREKVATWFDRGAGVEGDASIDAVRVRRCHGAPFDAEIAVNVSIDAGHSTRVVSITDVTARLRAQEAERRSQKLLEAHFNRTPVAVIEWRLDRSAARWNPAAEQMFGYRHDEVDGCDAFPLIVDESSRELVDRIWGALVSQTGGESCINTNRTKDGRIIQCRWHNTPLTDAEGRVIGVASLAEDITEALRAQRELSEANARLRRVVHKLPVVFWAFDENFVPVMWNDHAERVTGYAAERVIGNRDVFGLIYPDAEVRQQCMQGWAELDFGDYDDVERPVTCADGSVRRILWSNIAARCPVPGWRAWGIGIDVTDRHEAFTALRESERRYRDVIQKADLVGVIVDREGRITFVNDFFARLTGWSADEVIGSRWSEFLCRGGDVQDGGLFCFSNLLTHTEGSLMTKAGQRRTIVWTQSALHSSSGELAGACALGMDVTDHRRIQAELASHREHLEQLVAQRTADLAESQRRLEDAERLASLGRIAAGLSHDLGNMLLPVRCHLDTLEEADLDSSAVDSLRAVRKGVEFVEQLGEGLALLSGTNQRNSSEAAASPGECIRLAKWWEGVGPLLREVVPKSVSVCTRFDEDLPEVRLPTHLLTRAVMNLLVNAAEAIQRGGATTGRIDLAAGHDPEHSAVQIDVRDTGPGIPGEVARCAIEPFYTTKKRGLSTGLGLSVVDGIARLAGGSFRIEALAEGGTLARLTLPVALPRPTDHATPRVLVRIPDLRVAALCEELRRTMGCMILRGTIDGSVDYIVSTDAGLDVRARDSGPGEAPGRIAIDPSAGIAGIRETLARSIGGMENA